MSPRQNSIPIAHNLQMRSLLHQRRLHRIGELPLLPGDAEHIHKGSSELGRIGAQVKGGHTGTVPSQRGGYREDVRTRSSLVALGVLALVLTGCSTEAGPKARPGAGDPGPDALPTKLDALSADACFTGPQTQLPKGCEKYVTEVGNTAGSVHKLAKAGKTVNQPLDRDATALDQAVGAFRQAGCTTVPTPGGACTQALVSISAALTEAKQKVNQLATTG